MHKVTKPSIKPQTTIHALCAVKKSKPMEEEPLKLRPYGTIQICLLLLLFLIPVTQFPENEKNYAMHYKKVQK